MSNTKRLRETINSQRLRDKLFGELERALATGHLSKKDVPSKRSEHTKQPPKECRTCKVTKPIVNFRYWRNVCRACEALRRSVLAKRERANRRAAKAP